MLVRGAAGSIAIILLAGSAALAADASPGDASAPSQEAQGVTPAPAAPSRRLQALRPGPRNFLILPALPADYFATTPHLLGEWPGIRSKLSDLGINVSITGVDEAVMNFSGGDRRIAQEAGSSRACRPNSTCKRAWASRARGSWSRWSIAGAGTPPRTRASRRCNCSTKSTGAATSSAWSNSPGIKSGSTAGIETTAGRMAFGDEFFTYPCDFINLTFCPGQAGNLVGDYIYNWPVSQWAAVAKVNFGSEGYFKAGVFDSNTAYLDTTPNPASLPAFPGESQGAIFPAEVAWTPKFNGLTGSYQFGGWWSSDAAANVATSINGEPILVSGLPGVPGHGRYGFSTVLQQQLALAPDEPGQEEQRPERLSPRLLCGSPHVHNGLPDLRGNRAIRPRALEAEGRIWDCGRHDARQSEYRQRADPGQHPGRRPRLCAAQRIRNGSLVWLADDALAELEARRAIRDQSGWIYEPPNNRNAFVLGVRTTVDFF